MRALRSLQDPGLLGAGGAWLHAPPPELVGAKTLAVSELVQMGVDELRGLAELAMSSSETPEVLHRVTVPLPA